MLKKYNYKTGLEDYIGTVDFIDRSMTSPDYFRLFDVPDKLYLGKNSFRIKANSETLVKDSRIYIDVIDANGESIYWEIADFIGRDGSRLVIIYIYEDTAPGEAKILIGGRRKRDPQTGETFTHSSDKSSMEHMDYPNIMWTSKAVVVTNKANGDEIVYTKSPKVNYKERFAEYQKVESGQNRSVMESGSMGATLTLSSTVSPEQYSNTTRYNTSTDESSTAFTIDPESNDDGSISSQETSLPEYSDLPVLSSEGFDFKSDMVGGKIIVNGLDSPYIAYIVSIIDKNNVEVDRPYIHESGDTITTEFAGATDFTASYWTSDIEFTNVATESFLELTIDDLEPAAGVVDAVSISYRPYGTFGEFKKINTIELQEQNLLVDTSSFQPNKSGVTEKQIGNLKDSSEVSSYWVTQANSKFPFSMSFQSPKSFEKGFTLAFDTTESITLEPRDYLGEFKVKDNFSLEAKANTEYKLQFTIRYNETGSVTFTDPSQYKQVDIYISGSPTIESDLIEYPKLRAPVKNDAFGTYIGSIATSKGNTQKNNKLYFKSNQTGSISPVFVIRNGNVWEFKEITISPRIEKGYSPNTAKLTVPVDTFKKNNELVVKRDYENTQGRKSGKSSELIGLYFSGSNAQLTEIVSSSIFISSSMGNLQQVTDKGNTTTNDINVDGMYLGSRGKSFSTLLGVTAGENSTVQRQTAVGRRAGQSAKGNFNTAFGENSSYFSDGEGVTSTGYASALINSGHHLSAFGVNAARNNLGDSSSFFGYSVGYSGSGNPYTNVQIFGYDIYADKDNQVKLGSDGTELFTIGELNIDVSQSISDGDILTYDSTRGLAFFKSASSLTATTASYVDWPNIDNIPSLLSGSAQDNEVLFWSAGSLTGSGEFTYENETLKVSSSVEVHGDGTKDIFKAKKNNDVFFKINSDGVAVFEEFTSTPPSVPGGLMYSGSKFFIGL